LQIKVCLRKEIDKRPSALELLQHPFVRNAADKAPVAELVEVCIDEIEDFRAAEMAELESEANRGTWEVGSMGTSSQLGHIRASVCNFFCVCPTCTSHIFALLSRYIIFQLYHEIKWVLCIPAAFYPFWVSDKQWNSV